MIIEEAKKILIDTINNNLQHPNYQRTIELAKLYNSLITGDGISDLLRRFSLREDDKAFEQRKKITVSITDALSNSVMNPFEKVLRTDPLIKRIESSDESNIEILTNKLMEFYSSENQNSGLDYWLQTRFRSLSFLDPNSFVVLEWDSFDHKRERASPYPYEVPSSQAIYFEYENNKLQVLVDKKPIVFIEDDTKKKGFKFTLYGIGVVVAFERVSAKYLPIEQETIWKSNAGDVYAVRAHHTLLKSVPAMVIGYIGDKRTGEVTYVNPFHSGISYFKKILRIDSEADLSKTSHAFPQKMQYVQACPGIPGEQVCRSGKNDEGGSCSVCGGDGYIIHKSAQDAIVMPLPKHKDDMFDLDQLLIYKHPPIDILNFQEDVIDRYEQKIHAAVFNTRSLIKKTAVATATERDLDLDNVYDALHPFAEKITSLWSSIVSIIAQITETDSEDMIIDIRYPNDFKLKTIGQLIENLKTANDSGAPAFMRAKLSADIAEQTFIDQPEEYAKYQVKQLFYPFPGKSESEIESILTLGLVPFKIKLLYANFERLFRKAEREHMGFWQFKYEQQELVIDGYIADLETELKPAPVTFNPLA